MAPIKKNVLLGLNFHRGTREDTLYAITNFAKANKRTFVCFANVHMCVTARTNPVFAAQVNSSAITVPDGMPVAVALKLLYSGKQERIDGIGLMPAILKRAERENLSVFFYGSTNKVLKLIIARAKREFPRLRIAGHHAPPFRPLNCSEESETIDRINQSRTDLLLVALGCPKQERWMASMSDKIDAVMIGIGAAFPVYAGLIARAPMWMQRSSLEWFFRFSREPRRLFRRYFISNSLFFFFSFHELVAVRLIPFYRSTFKTHLGQIKS
jgi:N-acetylglucosaminyldiphosphoundecaprenol N-acetyl-beta-D-mannosaminyltransferase